jgi:hypothetical protein
MSRINFGVLDVNNEELKPVIRRLELWTRAHKNRRILDPRIISRELGDVDPTVLSLALQALVRSGFYRLVYMVTTPSGVLADGEYDDPESIPQRVPDRFNNYFNTADTDIVPVFKPTSL